MADDLQLPSPLRCAHLGPRPDGAGRVLFLDPFSGISGDMFLGALLDLGLDLARLQAELKKLKVSGYTLSAERVMRGKLSAIKFDVKLEQTHAPEAPAAQADPAPLHSHEHTHPQGHEHPQPHAHEQAHHAHCTHGDIRRIIEESSIGSRAKADSLKVFRKLAEAEGRIHNISPDQVAFHEVGAVDSIVDIVGGCIGLELLGIDTIHCAPVALGSGGYIQCAHGMLPIPAPATLELMKDVPVRAVEIRKELTTPTGAALVAALASAFGSLPALTVERIGYGAGSRDGGPLPNVLRALIGRGPTDENENADLILEIQANLDDATPETLGYVAELLLSAGALDVFFTAIQMKKSRPATLVTILAQDEQLDCIAQILFRESSTFGLRYQRQSRLKLSREIISVRTPYGAVRVKVGTWRGQRTSVHPEFEDCRALAQERGVPLKDVIDAARNAAQAG